MKKTVREWRKLRKIKRQELADALGISINTYIARELHPQRFRIADIEPLTKKLEVNYEDIIF